MTPYYSRDGVTIYCRDCLEVMPELEPDSIDSVVTDPPYGLSFMGKNWDHGIPGIPFWQAVLTVAKPGAMLLAFGGTRTYHRLTCAIEDAGWEIRDCVMWLYGSGFPKSHDISKAIDKSIIVLCDTCHGTGKKRNPNPTDWNDYWLDAPCPICDGKGKIKGAEREVVGNGIGRTGKKAQPNGGSTFSDDNFQWPGNYNITAPATPAAELWDGWGTALKPSFEPIVLAMAPMPSTFAANALEYGIAGLWVDGCRVGTDERHNPSARNSDREKWRMNTSEACGRVAVGRWPANVIHDGSEEVLAGFPVTNGSKPIKRPEGFKRFNGQDYNNGQEYITGEYTSPGYTDSGSAARFFYCAKASKRERGDGNNHPTVKPLELVRYLCRLTRTPTGGIVLDPFCGSGTTLLAARAEGRQAIGIELNEEYCQIAVERLKRPVVSLPSEPKSRNGKVKAQQLELI